jgi:UDPglucose 6-dehydrogenase
MKNLLRLIICLLSITLSVPLLSIDITVIGVGRLGLCVALCLEKAGHRVLGVDVSPEYIAQINAKSLRSTEPFVNEYLSKSVNFRATTSLQEGLKFSDIYFITVSTTIGTDAYNFSPLTELFETINSYAIEDKHIVLSSTVVPGYIRDVALPRLKDCSRVVVSYNPPFIAQGDIINGFCKPDMVLIGEGSRESGDALERMYKSLCPNSPHIARMSVDSAEIAKLALNCFITMKIAYANLVGDIADETPNADKFAILKAVGADSRVGSKCILPGFGFGGPCFPRDNRGLGRYAITKNIQPLLFESTDQVNALHAQFMAKKLLEQKLEEYVFEDISYKSNSPVKIIQESQKLAVARIVAESGKKVIIRDNKDAICQVQEKYGNLFSYQEL